MTKLNQVVATEKSIKDRVNKQTAPLFHAAGQPALFAGLTKTYEPVAEDGERLPAESVRVQHTVDDLLTQFAKATTQLLDVQLTKESANTEAFADVIVGGVTIVEKAPVSFLLQFEKLLTQEVRGLIVKLPTLDPAQEWSPDAADRSGVYVTDVIERHRTKKEQKPIVLYQATVEHAAQTQLITEDVLTGYWKEKKHSGAISAQRKQDLLDKVDALIVAVKFAREKANDRAVTKRDVGDSVFGYLFA